MDRFDIMLPLVSNWAFLSLHLGNSIFKIYHWLWLYDSNFLFCLHALIILFSTCPFCWWGFMLSFLFDICVFYSYHHFGLSFLQYFYLLLNCVTLRIDFRISFSCPCILSKYSSPLRCFTTFIIIPLNSVSGISSMSF